ncbi:MAG: hypothetical protein N2169_04955, partial [bacterium]|nr:hypothetical protein [bacterium]
MKRSFSNIRKSLLFCILIFFLVIRNVYPIDPIEEIKSPILNQKFEGSFKEVSIKNLLYFITSQILYNFIIEVEEDKKISITFKNTSIKEAIKSIIKYAELETVKINDETILIVPKNKAKLYKQKQKFVVKLVYTPADYVRNIIYSNQKDIDLIVDNFSNSLIIETSVDKIKPAV